ncbi:hypothetical protein GE09DRAFT_1110555, partial [Coniochaeta sp. 2T2.1]
MYNLSLVLGFLCLQGYLLKQWLNANTTSLADTPGDMDTEYVAMHRACTEESEAGPLGRSPTDDETSRTSPPRSPTPSPAGDL